MAGALVLRPANVKALWHLAGMQLAVEPLLNVSATCGLRLTGTALRARQGAFLMQLQLCSISLLIGPLTLHSLSHSSLVT